MSATAATQRPGTAEDAGVGPFRIDVPDDDLVELRRRIRAARSPERETVADASQGVRLGTIQALARLPGTVSAEVSPVARAAWMLDHDANSSGRLHWENKLGFFDVKGVSIPAGVSVFPRELYPAPERALFTSEVRAAFRSLR